MQQKNILIVSYVFPPYPGIGGRRWAKFAKYLHRNGHKVYVIGAENPFDNVSTFINDIHEIPKKNLRFLPAKYPKIIRQYPKTFLEKLQYHFWIKVLPIFTDGNFYDRTIFWKNQLHAAIRRTIQEKNIDTIITTGPPFHLVYLTVLLKKEFPEIKFIVDYRDEWTFNDIHGFGLISEKRRQREFEKEKFVCENADVMISPDESILGYLTNNYKINISKKIPHAFDKDDFKGLIIKTTNSSHSINISYFGKIQQSTNAFFLKLNHCLDALKEKHSDLYSKIGFHFYLLEPFPHTSIISRHKNKFKFYYNIPSHQLFNMINESHYILLMLENRSKDYFTSKYPEIFYLKKTILLYSEEGKVSEFIQKNKIGIQLPKENFYEELVNILQNPQQYNYDDFNLNEWDYEFVTRELEALL